MNAYLNVHTRNRLPRLRAKHKGITCRTVLRMQLGGKLVESSALVASLIS